MAQHSGLAASSTTWEGPRRHERAFLETADERAALPAEALKRLNLDIEEAVSIALATIRRVEPLLDSLQQLPIDLLRLQKLEVYIWAVVAAHARFRRAQQPPNGLKAVYTEAIEARQMLRLDAQNLMFHRLLPADALDRLRFRMGYHNVGYELLGLVDLHRELDATVTARSAVSRVQLDRAEQVATDLIELCALRTLEYRSKVDDDRRRAFTLLHRAYEELRRALGFVRYYDGDPALIAPALHASPRAGRPKKNRGRVQESNVTEPPLVVRQVEQLAPVLETSPKGANALGLLGPREAPAPEARVATRTRER